MKLTRAVLISCLTACSASAFAEVTTRANTIIEVKSPDGRIAVAFGTGAGGMTWSLSRDGKTLVAPSRLGLEFIHSGLKERSPALAEMKVVQSRRASADTIWETLLYRRGTVRDHYNELTVDLVEAEARAPKIGLG